MCTIIPFIGIIAIAVLMSAMFKLEAKQVNLELAKTRLSGEQELRKDGLYIGMSRARRNQNENSN